MRLFSAGGGGGGVAPIIRYLMYRSLALIIHLISEIDVSGLVTMAPWQANVDNNRHFLILEIHFLIFKINF